MSTRQQTAIVSPGKTHPLARLNTRFNDSPRRRPPKEGESVKTKAGNTRPRNTSPDTAHGGIPPTFNTVLATALRRAGVKGCEPKTIVLDNPVKTEAGNTRPRNTSPDTAHGGIPPTFNTALATALRRAGVKGCEPKTIVLEDHADAVPYLRAAGIVKADTPIYKDPTSLCIQRRHVMYCIQGRHVIGVLPLELAALAASVTTVTNPDDPAKRVIRSYTVTETAPHSYTVTEIAPDPRATG